MIQTVVVALLVAACALHAAWILAPAAARRSIARAALALPLPRRVAATMRRHAEAGGGCACDGCGNAKGNVGPGPKAPSAAGVPITIHRRPPR